MGGGGGGGLNFRGGRCIAKVPSSPQIVCIDLHILSCSYFFQFEVSPITKSKVLQPTQKASFLVNHSRPKITTTAEAKTLTATKGRLFSHRDKLIQTALPSLSSPPQPSSSPLIQPPAPLLASTASLTHSPSCNLAERGRFFTEEKSNHACIQLTFCTMQNYFISQILHTTNQERTHRVQQRFLFLQA